LLWILRKPFRSSKVMPSKPPAWRDLEPWVRDAVLTAYLQGKLDGSTNYRAAVHCVNVHQRDQRSRGARVGHGHVRAGGVFDRDRIFGRSRRGWRKAALHFERFERRSLDLLCNGCISSHRSISVSIKAADSRNRAPKGEEGTWRV